VFENYVVPALGGGLNLADHPAFIRDDQWAWALGFKPEGNTAEMAVAYTQINNGSYLSTYGVCQLLPDLVNRDGKLLVLMLNGSNDAAYSTVTATGTASALSLITNAVASEYREFEGLYGWTAGTAIVNGIQLVVMGQPSAGTSSVARWNGSAMSAVTTRNPLKPYFATAVGGMGLVANLTGTGGSQLVLTSDVGDLTDWTPDVSATVEEVYLSSTGTITGAVPSEAGVVITTRSDAWLIASTGGIPAVTAQRVDGVGSFGGACWTPAGVIGQSFGGIRMIGGGTVVPQVAQYARALNAHRPLWHPYHAAVGFLLTSDLANTDPDTILYVDPVRNVAWRVQTDNGTQSFTIAGQCIQTLEEYNSTFPRHAVVTSTGNILVEDHNAGTPSAPSSAYLETKDFAFDSPSAQDYVDRIHVDWEPLGNATTDAITVKAAVRNDFARQSGSGVLGTTGMQTSGLTFTTLGTLTAGTSELPVRLRGKFIRFRFEKSSGRVRIRGFTIRRQRASDRKL